MQLWLSVFRNREAVLDGRYRLWCGNRCQGARFKDKSLERDKGETERGRGLVVGGRKLDVARNGRRSSYATTRNNTCRSRPDRLRIDAVERRWRVKSNQVQCQFDEQEQE